MFFLAVREILCIHNLNKKAFIPVGCVLPACQPYVNKFEKVPSLCHQISVLMGRGVLG